MSRSSSRAVQTLNPMGLAIQAMSRTGALAMASQWIDLHISQLQHSTDPQRALAGRVLAKAKKGLGAGYLGAVAIVAAGQLLLGKGLAALGTLSGGLAFTHPVALTASAVAALYFGWQSLSPREREAILRQLSQWLNVALSELRTLFRTVLKPVQALR